MRLLNVTILFAASCSTHRPLSEVPRLAGKQIEVDLAGQPRQNAIAIQAADGMILRTETGDVALSDATQVIEIKRGRGAVQGLGIGLVIGATAGALLGLAAGDDEPCPDNGQLCLFNWTAGDKAAVLGILFGLLGMGTGAVVGYTVGAKDIYDLSQPQARFVPTGPPGSVVGGTVRF